jgi:hypothetical protein
LLKERKDNVMTRDEGDDAFARNKLQRSQEENANVMNGEEVYLQEIVSEKSKIM